MKYIILIILLLSVFTFRGTSQSSGDTTIQSKEMDTVTVVSTGYQVLPKERATGSFEQVKEKQLSLQFSPDILSRMESVSTLLFDKSNLPFRPTLTVRGVSSINGPKSPLIVLDNFPYEGDISTINPNIVESITILKDAAAASIWGARAGNGVIVITTKKGKYGQPLRIDFVANTSLIAKPDLMSMPLVGNSDVIAFEKGLFDRRYRFSDTSRSNRPSFSPVYEILFKERAGLISSQQAQNMLNNLATYDVRNDYKKYVYQQAVNQQYAVSVSNGSQRSAQRFTAGYDNNIDQLSAKYQRITLRNDAQLQLTKKLNVSTALYYTYTQTSTGKTGYNSTSDYIYQPLKDVNGQEVPRYRYREAFIDTAGQGRLMDWKYYPLSDYQYNKRTVKGDNLLASLNLQYQLLNSLKLNVNYQWEKQSISGERNQMLQSYYTRNMVNSFTQINYSNNTILYRVPKGDIIDREQRLLNSHNIRGQANFSKQIADLSVDAVAGGELRATRNTSNQYRVYGFDANTSSLANVDFINAYPNFVTKSSARIPSGQQSTQTSIRYVSVYANAALLYQKKYGFSFSARRDASNLFGVQTNQKWTPQWSAGVSWNISNEAFFGRNALEYLKLRASYGTSGNVDQNRSGVTTISYYGFQSDAGFSQAYISQFPNPELRWEKVSALNIGFDFALLRNKINGSIEFYSKRGSDLFGNAPIDYSTGLSLMSLTRNVANSATNGFDMTLNSAFKIGKFTLSSSLNLASAHSKVTNYELENDAAFNYISNGSIVSPLEGKAIYAILSYPWAGLDANGNPQSNLDGHTSTDYGAITGSAMKVGDLVYSGSAIPTFYGGMTNSIRYKQLELSVNVNFKMGYYFRRNSVSYEQFMNLGITHSDYLNRWQKAGDESWTYVPSFVYPNSSQRDAFYRNSAILVSKADHLRINFINLSYMFPGKRKIAAPFEQLQITVSASNLGLLWKANGFGIDPDYPDLKPSRKLSIGLKATF
ncbi:MAG: SusC/RagA family TonB-linked outer membrane protein [Chitinophagaceae bacterium]|nr:MAG: SusC/RagA family TonB-linked outer membrane protein [Chitinophagaceae bacterium]